MMRTLVGASFAAFLSVSVLGQSGQAPPTFELADVHVSPRGTVPNPVMRGGVLRAGRYELRSATMVDLIRTAYGVDADKVLGGPSWLELDRFNVTAKAPPSTPPEAVRQMLQTLLADRFKLVLHQDTQPLSTYALTIGSGKPKLTEAAAGSPPGCQGQPQTPEPGVVPRAVVACRNMTMSALAELLPRIAGAYVTSPVTDLTGLQGSWDFDLTWTARALLAQAGADGITIFDALDKQVGLKLELQRLPASAFVVDSVNRTPTDNPPGVAEALPPLPAPEFDVADIKPSPPDSPGPMARIQPTGQVNAVGVPLRLMINEAWGITSDDLLDGPKWLESARFDIIARAFAGPAEAQQFDPDTLRLMLRALLVDRFKVKTHTEERPVSAYTLTASRPRLTKADPSSRTRCTEGPAPNARDPRNGNPILSRLVTCQNMTMALFAERLQSLAPGYIRTPVTDSTGLEGAWDFSFNFSPVGAFQAGIGGRGGEPNQPAGGGLFPSDPTGALTVFEALDRQLGLKLEMQKRPMSVLVIDHIEEKPTDN